MKIVLSSFIVFSLFVFSFAANANQNYSSNNYYYCSKPAYANSSVCFRIIEGSTYLYISKNLNSGKSIPEVWKVYRTPKGTHYSTLIKIERIGHLIDGKIQYPSGNVITQEEALASFHNGILTGLTLSIDFDQIRFFDFKLTPDNMIKSFLNL